MNEEIELIKLSSVVAFLSFVITRTDVAEKFRMFIISLEWIGFFRYVVECTFCLSCWISLSILIINGKLSITNFGMTVFWANLMSGIAYASWYNEKKR